MEKLLCYSKINLFLLVKKNKFFKKKLHKIDSLFYKNKSLFDVIYIENNTNKKEDEINYFLNGKKIIIENCILKKILTLFRKKKYFINVFFKININKKIPIGSGLGGASSNAASLILFLCKKINVNFIYFKKDIQKIGTDILFFLYDYDFARVKKYGDKIKKINNIDLKIHLIHTKFNCSTKMVYNEFDSFYKKHKLIKQSFKNQLNFLKNKKDHLLQNDLLLPCLNLYPSLNSEYLNLILKYKNLKMSGSGSTFFILYFE